jgi:hypothetical protein
MEKRHLLGQSQLGERPEERLEDIPEVISVVLLHALPCSTETSCPLLRAKRRQLRHGTNAP